MAEDRLDQRSQRIFQLIVDSYIDSGEPVGSTTLSHRLSDSLSSATIRNVMAHLEKVGLLYSPHTSAGRLPTEQGLKLYVQGLLEVGSVGEVERKELEDKFGISGGSLDNVLDDAITALTGLSESTGVVMAPTHNSPLKHVEFVYLSPGQALSVLVSSEGAIENRVISVPEDMTPADLVEAGNYLSARLVGRTLDEAKVSIYRELELEKSRLNSFAQHLIDNGLGVWGSADELPNLIVRGQSNLLNIAKNTDDVSHIQRLFESLEKKEGILELLDSAKVGKGVQVFMGANSPMFNLSGCSMIVAPYKNQDNRVLGAIGVLGPVRQNYGRIIPMVNYTVQLIERFLKNSS